MWLKHTNIACFLYRDYPPKTDGRCQNKWRVLEYTVQNVQHRRNISCIRFKTTRLLSILNRQLELSMGPNTQNSLVCCMRAALSSVGTMNFIANFSTGNWSDKQGQPPWSCWPRPANSPSRSNARWLPCLGRWWPMLQVYTTLHVLQYSA